MPAMLRNLSVTSALLSCVVLCAGCGTSTSQVWLAETHVEVAPLEEPQFRENREAGMLVLRSEQEAAVITTPSERLYLVHKQTYSTWEWDRAGLIFFSVLGAVVTIGLYVLYALYIYNPESDDEN